MSGKLRLTLNADITRIMHIHTKGDFEVVQSLGTTLFLLLLNESPSDQSKINSMAFIILKKKT